MERLSKKKKNNSNYLAHYGKLGMHWGIRRYQPYPSSYTGDGKYVGETGRLEKKRDKLLLKAEKYRKNAETSSKFANPQMQQFARGEAQKADWAERRAKKIDGKIEEIKRKRKEAEEKARHETVEKFIKDNDIIVSTDYKWKQGSDRENKAADLGLRALVKIGVVGKEGLAEPATHEGLRYWFMVEDQTIGLGLVADQVNQGKTKRDIKTLVNNAKKAADKDPEMYYQRGYFELNEYQDPDDRFLDACLSEYKKNRRR